MRLPNWLAERLHEWKSIPAWKWLIALGVVCALIGAALAMLSGDALLWFWGVQVALHLLSWLYNWLIEQAHEREWMHNWTWLSVVLGVAYTLIGAAVAMWNAETTANTAVLGVVITFVSTGIPMSVGDIWRVLRWQKNGGDAVGGVMPSTGDKGKTHGDESSSSEGTSQPE